MSARAAAVVCALLATAASAQEGAVRTRVPGTDTCLYWESRTFRYNYHSAGSAQTPGTAEFVAMDAAFETWRTLARSCSDFVFDKGQMVGVANIGYDPTGTDNSNVIVYRENACRDVVPVDDPCYADGTCGNRYQCWDHSDATIALTTTTFSRSLGVVRDADIEFNASLQEGGYRFLFTTISSPPCEPGGESALCVATDIQNTLTHEIGHVIGLDHADVPGSTMEPAAPLGETQKRILDTGTSSAFCRVYAKGLSGPAPCEDLGEVEKKIVAESRGTPGLSHVGCSAAAGAFPWAALALLGARQWRLARRTRMRRS